MTTADLRVATVSTNAAPAAALPSENGSLTTAFASDGFWEVPRTDRVGRGALPGLERVAIAPALLERLSTTSSVGLRQVTRSAWTQLPENLPRGRWGQPDLTQLLDTLATARVERTSGSWVACDIRTLEDVLDDGTELVEEELLELLSRTAG